MRVPRKGRELTTLAPGSEEAATVFKFDQSEGQTKIGGVPINRATAPDNPLGKKKKQAAGLLSSRKN